MGTCWIMRPFSCFWLNVTVNLVILGLSLGIASLLMRYRSRTISILTVVAAGLILAILLFLELF
jgi:hypothetical protein